MASLNAELRCPVCLRIMRDPMATECLHRFCKDCIERCQRQNQKQCPSCRKPIATRRSLRPDPSMASLIRKLYPDLEDYEAEEEEVIEAANKTLAAVHLANIEKQYAKQREMQAQTEDEPQRRVEMEQPSSSGTGGAGAEGEAEGDDDDEVDADDDADLPDDDGEEDWDD